MPLSQMSKIQRYLLSYTAANVYFSYAATCSAALSYLPLKRKYFGRKMTLGKAWCHHAHQAELGLRRRVNIEERIILLSA